MFSHFCLFWSFPYFGWSYLVFDQSLCVYVNLEYVYVFFNFNLGDIGACRESNREHRERRNGCISDGHTYYGDGPRNQRCH